VLALLAELGRPGAPSDTAQLAVVDRWCRATDRAIFLADEDGKPVGLASVVVRERLGWATPEAWLSDLVVNRDVRRRGVGSVLIDACVELARAQGCRLLRAECGADRVDAQAFYARLGFKALGVDLRLTLD
jgi:GNAT superfamily N-acetyltransferase